MRLWSIITVLAAMLAAQVAQAAPRNSPDVAVYIGQYSALRNNANRSIMGGIEYRFRDQYYGIRPTVGVLSNTDGAFYGYAGINWDLPLGIKPIYITPGFNIGGYSKGDSKDLGYGLEFRSSIEVTYRFKNGQRLGAALSHLSNAGLGSENPGVETYQLVYSHPL